MLKVLPPHSGYIVTLPQLCWPVLNFEVADFPGALFYGKPRQEPGGRQAGVAPLGAHPLGNMPIPNGTARLSTADWLASRLRVGGLVR